MRPCPCTCGQSLAGPRHRPAPPCPPPLVPPSPRMTQVPAGPGHTRPGAETHTHHTCGYNTACAACSRALGLEPATESVGMTGMGGRARVCEDARVCSPYPEACPGLSRRERGPVGGPGVWGPDREARGLPSWAGRPGRDCEQRKVEWPSSGPRAKPHLPDLPVSFFPPAPLHPSAITA